MVDLQTKRVDGPFRNPAPVEGCGLSVYSIFYRVSTIQGSTGFCNHPQYFKGLPPPDIAKLVWILVECWACGDDITRLRWRDKTTYP